MSIGTEIKKHREENGLTQDELARLVCVSQGAIMQYERGYKLPSLAMLCRIADVLGTTPSAILDAATSKGAKA